MKCPKCQFDNREGAKFCKECGVELELVCPKCGTKLILSSKFCDECGYKLVELKKAPPARYSEPKSYTPKYLADKILTSRSSIVGERKLVSVLFADVANYTSISEKLDPEQVHQIMDGCFKILMDEVHKYEGTINQFTGDGVMALFGAPVAHEDHAQRACYAALSIHRSMKRYGAKIAKDSGVDFKIRIGINTGAVFVGAIGDDLRMDYTAIGETTNLAARIQQAANPGDAWVSRKTQRIIGGFFQVEFIGDQELKGISKRQQVYRLLAEHKEIRTRFEAGLSKGITELVGRRSKMEILKASWKRAKSGRAQVVDIVGEAGVGKTRLVYEFQNAIADKATFLTGVCIHYGRDINFLPLIDILRSVFEIEEGMSEKEAEYRVEERAADNLKSMIPFYRNLLSLKVDDSGFNALNPEGRKFGTFEAVKNLFLSLSKEKPLVVFIEDVHWIDKISEEFFVFFSHSIHGQRILMLTAYRPEGTPTWVKGSYYRQLGLETLSEESSMQVIRNILGGLELDHEIERMIVAKTSGNPFFIEEMVRELRDRNEFKKKGGCYILRRPIDRLDIPETVQGVIAARMDRLSEDLKRTTQVASVIGRDFTYKILRNIMGLGKELRIHLTNLVGLEILYEKTLYPEPEYIFKHALTQEVAYESLLKQRRREIHGRIARAIEELHSDKLEQHYEFLAHHWGLSDNPDRSIEYLVLAGEKSSSTQAARSAVNFFTRALNQLEKSENAVDPILMMRIRSGRANPFHLMGKMEESLEDYQEAINLGHKLGDQQAVLDCLAHLPFLLYNTALMDKVPSLCEEGLELARNLQDKGAQARIIASYAYWRYLWQRTEEYEVFQEARKLAKQSGKAPVIFFTYNLLSVLERWIGNPRQSLKYSEGMVEILQSVFNIANASAVSITRGWALTDLGKYNEAINFQNRWIDILERNSIYLILGRVYNGQGWTYSEIYDLQKASDFNTKSLTNAMVLRKNPALIFTASEMQAMAEVNLMENKFETGRFDDTWKHITRFEKVSIDSAYDLNRDRWSTRIKDLKGNLLLNQGNLDGAEQLSRQCLEVASKRKIKKYVGKAERLLGKVFTKRAAYEHAEAKFKSALRRLEEVENPKQLWITYSELSRLYKKMNRFDLEREQWQKAAQIVTKTTDSLQDNDLKGTFLSAPQISQILKGAKV